MKQFKSIGISYKTANLELRERVSFSEEGTRLFLRKCQEILGLGEVLLLSTCNRTEIYYLSEQSLKKELCGLINFQHGLEVSCESVFDEREGHAAIEHLFEVGLGVDSMVLGDIQITNQVKNAYQWAADENTAGPFMHRLLHSIFFTNKRVVQETELRDGTASTASVAVDIIKQYIAGFAEPNILILGLGEIGETVAENLRGINANVRVINRTKATAEQLAEKYGYLVGDIAEMQTEVEKAHVVVSAVRAERPIITKESLSHFSTPKLLIDLSVPRSIDDQLDQTSGILLYNIDQLSEKASKALEEEEDHCLQFGALLKSLWQSWKIGRKKWRFRPRSRNLKMRWRKSERMKWPDISPISPKRRLLY